MTAILTPTTGMAARRWGARAGVAVGDMRGLRFSLPMMAALAATSVVINRSVQDPDHVLHWASTDVHNLVSTPLRVLLASAVLVPGGNWIPTVILLALAAIPLERRIGSLRTLGVFASGHVLATLLTEGFVAWQITLGHLSHHEAFRVDVGSSYGMWAMFGALFFFCGRWRYAVLSIAAAYLLTQAAISPDVMTSIGHLLSLSIGVFWWSYLRRTTRQAADAV